MIIDIETNGLEPMENIISCISLINNKGELKTFCCDNEKEILTNFWNEFRELETLYGFNITSFDIPFLIKRSLINKIKMKKIRNDLIKDLRLIVNGFFYSYEKRTHGSLDDWAKLLGCEPKIENGEKMVEYYETKQFDKIKEHCEYDVILTQKLLDRCKECLLI